MNEAAVARPISFALSCILSITPALRTAALVQRVPYKRATLIRDTFETSGKNPSHMTSDAFSKPNTMKSKEKCLNCCSNCVTAHLPT